MPKGMIRSSFFEPWQEQAGLTPAPAYFALRAQRLLRERGLTKADLAAVVVKNRANGVDNESAMFRKAVTADEVLSSRVVCEPLHLWMLCSPNEGAAAVVLRREEGGVQLRAACVSSHLPGSVLAESTPLAGLVDDDDIPSPTAIAAAGAYDRERHRARRRRRRRVSGHRRRPRVARVRGAVVVRAGRAGQGAGRRRGRARGAQPVNPSGGLLSKGEPLGASGLGQVVELVHQLRSEAGPRQVDGARTALAHTIGRGANASVVILSR